MCFLDGVSCGMVCNKDLPCGNHKCKSTCHDGPCFKEGVKCTQPCSTLRPACGHPCGNQCHEGPCPETPCKAQVRLWYFILLGPDVSHVIHASIILFNMRELVLSYLVKVLLKQLLSYSVILLIKFIKLEIFNELCYFLLFVWLGGKTRVVHVVFCKS